MHLFDILYLFLDSFGTRVVQGDCSMEGITAHSHVSMPHAVLSEQPCLLWWCVRMLSLVLLGDLLIAQHRDRASMGHAVEHTRPW